MEETTLYQKLTREILQEFPFPMHFRGYAYLCSAITLYAQKSQIKKLNELYQQISDNPAWETDDCIRRTILYAWKHGNPDIWKKYFPEHITRPSVFVFIKTIARHLVSDTD